MIPFHLSIKKNSMTAPVPTIHLSESGMQQGRDKQTNRRRKDEIFVHLLSNHCIMRLKEKGTFSKCLGYHADMKNKASDQ